MIGFIKNFLLKTPKNRCYNTLTETSKDIVKVYLMDNKTRISPWHDVPVWSTQKGVINIVNEIP